MSTPDTVQLSEFTPASSVAATDLVYSASGATGVEKATTVAQLQTFIQSPIANSTLANAGTLTGAETIPLGKSGLFQASLMNLSAYALGSYAGITGGGAGAAIKTSLFAFQNVSWLHPLSETSAPFSQIPIYPQTFGANATRIIAGAGAMKSVTRGTPSTPTTAGNPSTVDQLWTNAAIAPIGSSVGTNWIANKAVQTTIGSQGNALFAGVFSEAMHSVPNNGELAALVGFTRANGDRNPSGTGSGGDMWGAWLIASNNGHRAHAIGVEVNATNQYANWMESTTPLYSDPTDFTFGVHVYPDWSTYHNTRAISIRPNATVGWSTGILVSGWVDQGMYIDTTMEWENPPTNSVANNPRGIVFGSNIMTKMAFQTGETSSTPGVDTWKMNVEGNFLLYRASPTSWYLAMNSSDQSLWIQNGLFKFDTAGRLNVNGSADVGVVTGPGLTIQGDVPHPLAMTRSTVAPVAPGANIGVLRFKSGTTAGTLKLVVLAGSSATEFTVLDNIGTGNS